MRHFMETGADQETISVGRILQTFGERGFAFLLLILAILNNVIFMVPFLSFFLGLPMVILTAQMVIGLHAPVFPIALRQRKIKRAALVAGLSRAVKGMEKVEHYIKPRLTFLLDPPFMRIHALAALVLAMMVTLPIPVINVPPSIALIFLAIGLLQKDGLFIIAGYSAGIWCLWLFRSIGHVVQVVMHAN